MIQICECDKQIVMVECGWMFCEICYYSHECEANDDTKI